MIQITKVVQPTEGAIVVARCPLCKVTHIGSNWRLVKPADGDYWLLAGCPLSAHRDVPLNCEVGKAVTVWEPGPPAPYAGEDVNVSWVVKGGAGHYVEEPRAPRVDEFAIVTEDAEEPRAGGAGGVGPHSSGVFTVVAEDAERVLPSQWRSS